MQMNEPGSEAAEALGYASSGGMCYVAPVRYFAPRASNVCY